MSIRTRIRDWLGLDTLEMSVHEYNAQLSDLRRAIYKLTTTNAVNNLAIGRIIAKKEHYFGVPEDDPKRKAASDKLGEQVIKRLEGEFLASRKHNP
jgi:hypothetical protein